MSVRIGRMKDRVDLCNPMEAQDQYGGRSLTFEKVATVWAAVEPVSSTSTGRSGSMESSITHRVVIRYTASATPKTVIRFGTRLLKVVGIFNEDERGFWISADCEEVPSWPSI